MSIDKIAKEGTEIIKSIMAPKNGVKKTKTPRQYDSILKGALALELKYRIALKNVLLGSIETEVKHLKERAEEAEKLANETVETGDDIPF